MNKRLTQSKANLVQAEGAYQDSLKMSSDVEALLAYTNIMANPDVAQISADVAKHENRFVEIRQRYREKHPKYASGRRIAERPQTTTGAIVLKVRTRLQEGCASLIEMP